MQIYLDNTATSWPKPITVASAICEYLTEYGASPGRSGHSMSVKAAGIVADTRSLIASLFNVEKPERVMFFPNSTHATNTAFKGFLKKGDHAIISHMEHNSTLRPLRFLQENGIIDLSIIDCDKNGRIDLEMLKKSFRPNTKLVSMIHGSNIIGIEMPVSEIGTICRERNVAYHVDAAQSAGFLEIDMQKDKIDILTFTGHKKLYGPSGIGGMCLASHIDIDTLIHGGSGSKSESDRHPDNYPDKLEAGTTNTVGIAGLKAGIEFILSEGQNKIRQHSQEITAYFIQELSKIEEIRLHGPETGNDVLPVISITTDLYAPDKLAAILDKDYGIMVRAGLHCNPLAHKSIGTFPAGTLRFSPGYFNTQEEIDFTVKSLKTILR